MIEKDVISSVEQWLKAVVVGLNLCPFARTPLAKGTVRVVVTRSGTPEDLLRALAAELQYLERQPETETTLLVHPDVLGDFYDYNQFLTPAEHLLLDLGYEGVFQIASFHPRYQFAGTDVDDAQNYSNRSPHPLLHILREETLEAAIVSHPNTEQIPDRNIEKLTTLGRATLERMLSDCAQGKEP